MKTYRKNKISKSWEQSFANCIPIIVPLVTIGIPLLLLFGFICVQANHIYNGDWIKVEDNVYAVCSYIFIYILGAAPKDGLLSKLWN